MFLIKKLWTSLVTPLALSRNMISPLEILVILMIGFTVYSSLLPITPTKGGWSVSLEWFASGSGLGVFGFILLARGLGVGVGIAKKATTVGGVIITFAGAAMIGIAVVYVIWEITQEFPAVR